MISQKFYHYIVSLIYLRYFGGLRLNDGNLGKGTNMDYRQFRGLSRILESKLFIFERE